jgi:hypothetical protein
MDVWLKDMVNLLFHVKQRDSVLANVHVKHNPFPKIRPFHVKRLPEFAMPR